MSNKSLLQQSFQEPIGEQLTLQDIHLRHHLIHQNSTDKCHQVFKAQPLQPYCSLQLKKQTYLGESHLQTRASQPLQQRGHKNVLLNESPRQKQIKITSIAYRQRSSSLKNKQSLEKKQKISVSLTSKVKSNKSLQSRSFPLQWNIQNEVSEKGLVTFGKERIQVKLKKENHLEREIKGRTIKQPCFHQKHPLQISNKLNGGCLSKIIMHKAKDNRSTGHHIL